MSAELQAVQSVDAFGSTAYVNLEPVECGGGSLAVKALVEAGVQRVVIGMLHPLSHLLGQAIKELNRHHIDVTVLGVNSSHASDDEVQQTLMSCLAANEPLLHRAATRKPFSVLKYAMTLDGKIAASTGHSAWVSCPTARQRVFATRAISDAVIVGGNTVRRDNPNLTTRREGGFSPTRIVMSRTLDLQSDANLWKIGLAPTIVMTQRGARSDFQQELRDRGIEVVEFDFLSPSHVVDYCYERGFLQLLWECGGTLSAPAIASGVIHKVMAFVSPKIIGGTKAPTPCGDLGFVEMTQAVQVTEMNIEQIGPDVLLTGYLPSSGGLCSLHGAVTDQPKQRNVTSHAPLTTASEDRVKGDGQVVKFYKAWDEWGGLSNFTVAPIRMFDGAGPHGRLPSVSDQNTTIWQSVEHYYQAQKFAGMNDPEAEIIRQRIFESESAEEAAKIGRRATRERSSLRRPDWFEKRQEIMREAVLSKFQTHEDLRHLLLSTNSNMIVEDSPHDFFWGVGVDGSGTNHLGKMLMSVRESLLAGSEMTERENVLHCLGDCS